MEDLKDFRAFRKVYRSNRQMMGQLYTNFYRKTFTKEQTSASFPNLLNLSSKDKQDVKTFMPKYTSKYLEKTEAIFKRLKSQFATLNTNLQKTAHSFYAVSELFVELFNQKKQQESKIRKKVDNLKEVFSSSSKMFVNLGEDLFCG